MKKIGLFLVFTIVFSCKKKSNISVDKKVTVAQLPYFNSADFTPEWKKGEHKIPDFSFTNQNGELITNDTYADKIYIADFFFTICPGICLTLTKNMNLLQEKYATDPDIMLLSHSVMPWYDTVEKLSEYAKNNSVNSTKWNLVTGNKEALYNIARNGYFADEDFTKTQNENNFIHTENLILIDKKGYIRGVYNGTLSIDLQRLNRHINILKNEY